MNTIWGERLDRQRVLAEYPRPQLRRERWLNLNGEWDYAFAPNAQQPPRWAGKILVPFSPECDLSGVNRALRPGEFLWYRRRFRLSEDWAGGRTLLHFGAVDQRCVCYLNGVYIGAHTGGYTAFTLELGDAARAGDNELVLCVADDSDRGSASRGKQKIRRGGIWYTPQSGIWQTVWLEPVPQEYIERLVIEPLFDERALRVTVCAATGAACVLKSAGEAVQARANEPAVLPVPHAQPWSPEQPRLYPLTVRMGADRVESYFGMRKFEVRPDSGGTPRFFLNNRPYFNNGVLDQGYWCDGMLTPPDDEAMVADILYMKSLGFNMLRKHIKIEPMRWYYHCDRLGMLVWQDMVNGGGAYNPLVVNLPVLVGGRRRDSDYRAFGRQDGAGRAQYLTELEETVRQLQNVTSLAVWVPFNEGWGQFDALAVCERVRALDPTRPVDHASGWHDQGGGDFKSLHVYFRPYRFRSDPLGRAVALTEFGGYALRVEGHAFTPKDFGYKKLRDSGALAAAFRRLYESEILPAKAKGLCACVYTQLSDVEDELNGFVTYDRRVRKLRPEDVRDVIARLNDG